jgi:hypothetical protein
MKNNNALIIFSIVALVAVGTLGFSQITQGMDNSAIKGDPITVSQNLLPNYQSVTTATSIPVTTATAIQPRKITFQAIQKYAKSSIQTVTAQGIEISATNFIKEGNEVYVDVCYQLPDNSDWTINQATLITRDSQELVLSGGSGLEFTQTLEGSQRKITQFIDNKVIVKEYSASQDVPDYRCDRLDFILSDSEKVDLSSIKLTIDSLIAIPREGEECQVYNDKIQTALDAEGSGIKFQCIQSDGGPQIQIINKPSYMSLADAQNEISKYSITDVYRGPWDFESSVQ